jgi:Flp pilus assembly pilin Flp
MLWFGIALMRDNWERARGARERGASALEWAIIAAIVVVAATAIGAAIFNIVQDKTTALNDCANQPVGSAC